MPLLRSKILLIISLLLVMNSTLAKTYYVNAVKGKDSNNGLSINSPWKSLWKAKQVSLKPGDKLLLSNQGQFTGSLAFKGLTGSIEQPIIISNYSEDNEIKRANQKAKIDAKGHLHGIYLLNSKHVNVSNIEVQANAGGIPKWLEKQLKQKPKYKWQQTKPPMRIGVFIESKAKGTFGHIHLDNLFVHDIFYADKGVSRSKNEVHTPNGTQSYGWGIRFISSNGSTLEHLKVTNSTVKNVAHTGIKFTGDLTEVELHKNIIIETGGPGIQMSGVKNAHVSHNKVDSSGNSNDSRKWGRGSGMWTWGSSNILIEHNQFTNASGPADSAGIHIDYNCDSVVVQYNLSVNNAGGFCEILGNNFNNAYRYNISINDGYRIKGVNNAFQEGKTLWLSGYQGQKKPRSGPFNSYFYNNTIFAKSDVIVKIAVDGMTQGALITNNIFHIVGESKAVLGDQYRPEKKGKKRLRDIVFENNLYLKKSNWPAAVAIQDKYPIVGNAGFVNAGGTKLSDYIPQNIELIKNKGIEIKALPNDSIGLKVGLQVSHDILGNEIVGLPDMGAIEITTNTKNTKHKIIEEN